MCRVNMVIYNLVNTLIALHNNTNFYSHYKCSPSYSQRVFTCSSSSEEGGYGLQFRATVSTLSSALLVHYPLIDGAGRCDVANGTHTWRDCVAGGGRETRSDPARSRAKRPRHPHCQPAGVGQAVSKGRFISIKSKNTQKKGSRLTSGRTKPGRG